MQLSALKEELQPLVANKQNVMIEITMTQSCNCNCEYCFEPCHSSIRNIEEEQRQIKLLDEFCAQYDKTNFNILTIVFWGGEPFLNFEFMSNVIEHTCIYDFVQYKTYSNGTLYEKFEELIQKDFFKNIAGRFHIQLSYDGEPHHKLKRKYDSAIVLKTARLLKDNGIDVSFKATLSFDMLKNLPYIWDSYNALYSEFGDCVSYSPTLDVNASTLDFLDEWKKSLIIVAKKEIDFISKHGRPLMTAFRGKQKCVCNVDYAISINVDGNIYVCHGCPYAKNKQQFILGNTNDDIKLEQFMTRRVDLSKCNESCDKCVAVYCSVCHALQVDEDYSQNWISCMDKNKIRCQYFKAFGIIYRAFMLAKNSNR